MRKPIGNQGEIRIDKIDALPDFDMKAHTEKSKGAFIISHSEQGHHHVLGGDVDVMERTKDVPKGMRILYAVVKEPTALKQDAAVPHGEVPLDAGIYEFRIKREFDPFEEEMRAVMD